MRRSPVRKSARHFGLADFFVRLVREKPLGTASGIVVLLLILVSIFADVLAPYPIDEHTPGRPAAGPIGAVSPGYRPVGARLLESHHLRGSSFVGCRSGGDHGQRRDRFPDRRHFRFLGGKLDLVVQRFVDAWMAFPGLLILLTVMSITGRVCRRSSLVLGISGGIAGSRVLRSAVIGVKEGVYFQAAEASGSTKWRTLIRHVLPIFAAPVIVIFSINVGGVIMAEASLSFLGFGLPAQIPKLGRDAQQRRTYAHGGSPLAGALARFCLTVVVYVLNMFAMPCATCSTRDCGVAGVALMPLPAGGLAGSEERAQPQLSHEVEWCSSSMPSSVVRSWGPARPAAASWSRGDRPPAHAGHWRDRLAPGCWPWPRWHNRCV